MPTLLLAALLAAGPVDPLMHVRETQVTGWSADETKFSVRAFERSDGTGEEEAPECPGYVDHLGKKFKGRLWVAAYDQGKLVESWLVQDYPECTAAEKAKTTLTAAKAKFLELGIDLKAKLTALDCKKGCDLGHDSASLIFENATKTKEQDDGTSALLQGTLRVVVKKGAAKTTLFEHKLREEFGRMMGGNLSPTILPVEVSPSGKAVIIRLATLFSSGRGGNSSVIPAGFFMWESDGLKRK